MIGSTAYVASPLQNAIVKIPAATTRTTADVAPIVLSSGGDLHQPIAMVATPNGDLLTTNGLNGDVVEVSTGRQASSRVRHRPRPCSVPAGSGDLFGLAVAPNGKSLYFAKDDTNTLAELS